MARVNKTPIYPIMLSPARLAQAVEIKPDRIYEMIADGLPAFQFGNKRRIFIRDFDRYVRRNAKRV